MATIENIEDLQTKGFLDTVGLLPVIRDAMTACIELGIDCVWIDLLCIIQNDQQDKMSNINAMDIVYANSVVTLVAIAGKDASCGLPGVNSRKRPDLCLFKTQSLF